MSGRPRIPHQGLDPLPDLWMALQQSAAFWDVDASALNLSDHADWIIDRVLQFGQWEDWAALFALYSPTKIHAAIHHRRVPDHIRQFWQAYFLKEENRRMYPETLHPDTASLWHRYGAALLSPKISLGRRDRARVVFGTPPV